VPPVKAAPSSGSRRSVGVEKTTRPPKRSLNLRPTRLLRLRPKLRKKQQRMRPTTRQKQLSKEKGNRLRSSRQNKFFEISNFKFEVSNKSRTQGERLA
jgi:hypothetical protein